MGHPIRYNRISFTRCGQSFMRIQFPSHHMGRYKLFFLGFVLLFPTFGAFSYAAAASTDTAKDGRLVTIHDRGEERVILTHAQTVKDALDDAKISVVPEDTVEPGLSQEMVANSYTVNIYRARPVIVVDGALREKIMTSAQTSRAIAKDAGLSLSDEDKAIVTASDDIVADGASVVLTIDRATPINLNLYGSPRIAYTQEGTVGAMLDKKGIKLGPSDTLSVDRDTPIASGMNVSVWRDGVQTVNVEEIIPYKVRQVQDFDHPVGYRQVQTPGVNGKRTVTYELNMLRGRELSRKEIQSVVWTQPTEQVEVVGAGLPPGSHQDWMAAAGIAASDFGYVAYIVDHENRSWDPCKVQGGAVNCNYSGSMGYGLVQATPGGKMVSAGADWRTNPVTQLKWASSYAVKRYGSWKGAYDYWVSHRNW